jgi:hypothetical protein
MTASPSLEPVVTPTNPAPNGGQGLIGADKEVAVDIATKEVGKEVANEAVNEAVQKPLESMTRDELYAMIGKQSDKQLYGSVLSGAAQGFFTDKAAEKKAESEANMMSRPYERMGAIRQPRFSFARGAK